MEPNRALKVLTTNGHDRVHRHLVSQALRSKHSRALLAVLGVASATMLVLALLGVYRSLTVGVTNYITQPHQDLWVAPQGVDNMVRAFSLLPAGTQELVATVPGVARADPLAVTFATVQPAGTDHETRLTLMAIGYDVPRGLGGPPGLRSGRAPKGDNEVALDRAAAFRLGVNIGDQINLNGSPRQVVGLTVGTNLLATQFVFMTVRDAQNALGVSDQVSFVVVQIDKGARPRDVTKAIMAAVPNVSVFQRQAFVDNNVREVASGLLPILALLTIIGLVVAAIFVGLLVQGLVEDRRSDIAVLFAQGAQPASVASALVLRMGRLVLAGSLCGVAAALALGWLLDTFAPTVELTYHVIDLVAVVLLFCIAGVGATVVPVLRLQRIDPLEAFRS